MTDESQQAGWAWDEGGVGVIAIKLWGAVSLPRGIWYAEAGSLDAFDRDWTEVEDSDDSETISIVPRGGANPFVGERSSAHTFCIFDPGDTCGNLYAPGDLVQIAGAALPPSTTQFLVVYYGQSDSDSPAEPFYARQVTTDSAGRFQVPLRLGSSIPSGFYWLTFGNAVCAPEEGRDECFHIGPKGCFEVK
jgi:hypothetical protein